MRGIIEFKCPTCGSILEINTSIQFDKEDNIEKNICTNCGKVIDNDEIYRQAHDYVNKIVREMLRKNLR